jgi:predicted Zn finger-like uncharacterized protein
MLEINMKVSCPKCHVGYRIDPEKIPEQGAFLRCKKCTTRFPISRPTPAPADPDPPAAVTESGPATEKNAETPDSRLAGIEERISRHLESGNEDECVKYIVEQVTRFADTHEFELAESMRTRLYDVAPMALNDIIRTSEIIETAKQNAMDKGQLKLWGPLYDRLEPGEACELYFALKKMPVAKGHCIFNQGEFNSKLYFVQDGSFAMTCYDPGRQEHVKLEELIAGDVANIDSFFNYTICTYTLTARRDGVLSYLDKDILAAWKENYAGLEPKLNSFCREKDVFGKKMTELGLDKRAYERVQTSALAMVQLLDTKGKPVQKPFKIALFDISCGGVSFGMNINKKEEAEMLLQHRMFLQTIYKDGSEKKKIGFKGQVVAVHLQPFGESSVHVQFDQPQDEALVKAMAR